MNEYILLSVERLRCSINQKPLLMRKILTLSIAALFLFMVSGCEDDDNDQILDDGLTREIHELVPAEILETSEGLGMPVYGGGQPPSIENIFECEPLEMIGTNVPNDSPVGTVFATLRARFYNQNNDKYTISVDYTSGGEEGTGLGGFVVGDDDYFTVFAELDASRGDAPAELVLMFSGKLVSDGIENLHVANFMLDNHGNEDYWIPDGTGRVFHDADGHSGIVSSVKESKTISALPGLSGE